MPELSNVLCACGCGRFTNISTKTYARIGIKKGEPNRFVSRHRAPLPDKYLSVKCECGEMLIGKKSSKKFCDKCLYRRKTEADKLRQKDRRAKSGHRERYRTWCLKKKYGLTREQYDSMLDYQDNRCAICRSDKPNGKTWHVDHSHVTGKVRGVLCGKCNAMIGFPDDDIEILARAIEYLKAHADV